MSDPTVDVVERALEGIERIRKRVYISTIVMWVATVGMFLRYGQVARTSDNLEAVIAAAVLALVATIFLAAFGIIFFVTRMTKRLLRAIHTTASAVG